MKITESQLRSMLKNVLQELFTKKDPLSIKSALGQDDPLGGYGSYGLFDDYGDDYGDDFGESDNEDVEENEELMG